MLTTSVAVVYAVMLEYGFNKTAYGKTILAACFITDLGTVLALGFIFAPFDIKMFAFAAGALAGSVGNPGLDAPPVHVRHHPRSRVGVRNRAAISSHTRGLSRYSRGEMVVSAH